MLHQKLAASEVPIHDLIAKRWSPYAFADRPVSADDLRSLFEAARWAASSYNEQPWSYIIATRDQADDFDRLLDCLVEGNRLWAKAAPVLAIGCTSLFFTRGGKPNAAAIHDLGASSATLTFEATARGLFVHQMIGILPDRAREAYSIPEGTQPTTGLAIGYAAASANLPERLRDRDTVKRERKKVADFVFSAQWGTSAEFLR
jgi:nitroreductase